LNEPTQPSAFSESLLLFDSAHLAALGLSLLAIVCVPLIGRCLSVTNRRRAVWALIVFAVAPLQLRTGDRRHRLDHAQPFLF
jgi:hypothetical protein